MRGERGGGSVGGEEGDEVVEGGEEEERGRDSVRFCWFGEKGELRSSGREARRRKILARRCWRRVKAASCCDWSSKAAFPRVMEGED